MNTADTQARPASRVQGADVAAWAGIALILGTGLIHLYGAPDSFNEAFYKGALFVVNGIGALIAAIGIARGSRTWGWGLGLLVAAGAIAGYVASRTVGLPGLEAEPDAWLEPLGVASLVLEGLFVVTAVASLRGKVATPDGQRVS